MADRALRQYLAWFCLVQSTSAWSSVPLSAVRPQAVSVRAAGRLAPSYVLAGNGRRRAGAGGPAIAMAAVESEVEAWKGWWKSVDDDVDITTLESSAVEGTIPSDLVGTLYRAGPGKFELGEFQLQHPLDGDGLVTAFTFPGDGTVSFRRRFVKTEQRIKETRAVKLGYKGEPIKRGFFGSGKQGGMVGPLKNAANVAAYFWGGSVMALSEAAPPVELDPAGLYTKGETRIKNALPRLAGFLNPRLRFDPASECLVGFRCNAVELDPTEKRGVNLYAWDSDWALKGKRFVPTQGNAYIPDIAFTRKNFVVHQPPTKFDPLGYSVGGKAAAAAISFDAGRPALFHITPRDGSPGFSVEAPAAVLVQIANAYETPEGAVVVDAIETPRLPLGSAPEDGAWREALDLARDVPPASLVRYTITAGSAQRATLSDAFQAFPTVNPFVTSVRHQFIYTAAAAAGAPVGRAAPLQRVLKTDVSGGGAGGEWSLPPGHFCGEPIFVPKPTGQSEDDGYLVVQVHDGAAGESALVVLNALSLADGPLARARLPATCPPGLYGSWADGYVPQASEFAQGKLAAAFAEKEWNDFDGGLSMLGF